MSGADQTSFWRTLPGVLTGIAAVIVAIGGLIAVIHPFPDRKPVETQGSATPTDTPSVDRPGPATSKPDPGLDIIRRELVLNGNAEADCGSRQADAPVPKWTRLPSTSTFTIAEYGDGSAGGFPKATSGQGRCMFAGGPSSKSNVDVNQSASAFQIIEIPESDLIKAGKFTFILKVMLGGYTTNPGDGTDQDDVATLSVDFLDENSMVLTNVQIGPVTDEERNHQSGLREHTSRGSVPPATRGIKLTLTMTKKTVTAGAYNGYNDGYADNVSLILND